MRISPLVPLLLVVAGTVRLANGFVVRNPTSPGGNMLIVPPLLLQRHQVVQLRSRNVVLFQSSTNDEDDTTDDYDDWYADFDPSEYEDMNEGKSTSSSSSSSMHDYKRDLSADNSHVNQVEIDALISERLEYRKTGRFQQADAIRDELLQKHGVVIFDREKVWRSGCSTGGSGSKWRPQQQQQQQRGRGSNRKKRDFGPNGHDYNLSPDAGPNTSTLSEDEIHALLAERLECKMSRNFQHADAIQDELIQAGVFIHDGNKEWRADGKGFGDVRGQGGGRPGRDFGSRNDRNRPYQQSPQSLPTNDQEEIQALVDERVEAKKFRDYRVADDIRDELRQEFNVEVNDRLRMWSVGGDFGIPQQRDTRYSMSQESQVPDNADEIQQLVEQRNEARKVRDFDTADAIRDDLLDQNIMIDDKLRQWAVGGRFSANNRRNAAASFDAPFVKRGAGGDLTDEQVALIEELLQERSEAKRNKDFGKADRIRDRLQADFKVRVDDRAREWHVVSDKYAMNPIVSGMDESIRALIEERLVERSVAKLERDYETADAIRDELAQVYNVDIDDRVREWTVIGAPMAVDDDSVFDVDESDFEFDDEDEEGSDIDIEVDEDESESAADDFVETMEAEDLTALTIPELKVRLKEAGLPVSGRKAELIERLTT